MAITNCVVSGFADTESLFREMTIPLAPAGPLSVTVPVDGAPPATELGLKLTEMTAAGTIFSDAWVEKEPLLAVTVTVSTADTGKVGMAKVVRLCPEGIVTVFGTVASMLLEERATTMPAGAASPFRVRVPVEDTPPSTCEGAIVNPTNWAGLMVRAAD